MKPYVIVAGDLTRWGGMDRPNYELAWYLADGLDVPVHLVSHFVASPLAEHRNVTWHRVRKPANSYTLAAPLLAWAGRDVARRITKSGGRVIVNGGNCSHGEVNWMHTVLAPCRLEIRHAPFRYRTRAAFSGRFDRATERRAVANSRLVLTNSERARTQIRETLPVAQAAVETVYYGIDPHLFRPPTPAERVAARERLEIPLQQPIVSFIGALAYDRRKGFDVLFEAWCELCADSSWDAHLVVAGSGLELEHWRRRTTEKTRQDRITFLGFTKNAADVLAASDALVAPTRFEAYGQGVHEALCCGVPAFVTRIAGVAERYPDELQHLLLDDPPSVSDVIERLRRWREDIDQEHQRVASFSATLRERDWTAMARDIFALIEQSK